MLVCECLFTITCMRTYFCLNLLLCKLLLLQVCLLLRRFCLGTTSDRTGRSKAKHMSCIALCIYPLIFFFFSPSLLWPRADAHGGGGGRRWSISDRGASLGPSGRSFLLDPGLPRLRGRICEVVIATSCLRSPADCQLSADMVGMLLYRMEP
jgi:hypothetical protein